MLDLLREDLDLGVVELVARRPPRLDLGDQHLCGVVLDIGFLELVLVDLALAGRVEDLLLDLGVDGELQADLLGELLLAAVALGCFESLNSFSTSR